MNPQNLKTIQFQLPIPNREYSGIVETITLDVQTRLDEATGEEVLTPESVELIENTQARHMGLTQPPKTSKP